MPNQHSLLFVLFYQKAISIMCLVIKHNYISLLVLMTLEITYK